MATVKVSPLSGRPLLDISSYARRGPGRRDRLSSAEVAVIARTVHRAPEVMVKVLTRASTECGSVAGHLGYLGRYGELGLETDEGERLQGRVAGKDLLNRWDLDLEELARGGDVTPTRGRDPPRLVHKLVFSMPPGTPPHAVLGAARSFLREEFGLKHHYAFVLHTDEPHPHVHAVVKAVSEQGVRLHIKKATLRFWRQEFARHLRSQGIEANATDRGVRGQSRASKIDAVYRAAKRGRSSHMLERVHKAALGLTGAGSHSEDASNLLQTRSAVVRGWNAMKDILREEGRHPLADAITKFVSEMSPPWTERNWLRHELISEAQRLRSGDKQRTR